MRLSGKPQTTYNTIRDPGSDKQKKRPRCKERKTRKKFLQVHSRNAANDLIKVVNHMECIPQPRMNGYFCLIFLCIFCNLYDNNTIISRVFCSLSALALYSLPWRIPCKASSSSALNRSDDCICQPRSFHSSYGITGMDHFHALVSYSIAFSRG